MAAAGQKGEYSQQNEEMMLIFLIIAVPVCFYGMWFFFGKYVYHAERMAIYFLLSFGGLIGDDWPVVGWFSRQYNYFRYTDFGQIPYLEFSFMDSILTNSVLFLLIVVFAFSKFHKIGAYHPFEKYGRTMNLYDYIYDQMPVYPHLRLMWKLRLLSRPVNEGLFRMSDSLKEFCIRNNLVSIGSIDAEPVVDEDEAIRVFSAQLGRMMPLPSEKKNENEAALEDARNILGVLDNNEKAVLAAIVTRLNSCDSNVSDAEYQKGIDTSERLVKQFWVGFDSYHPALPTKNDDLDNPLKPPPPPVDTTGCDEILVQYLSKKFVRAQAFKFAYVRTFIYDAIQACRKVGKFPPCELRWLMILDRELDILVNCAGRREAFWECAGVHAHYLYERKVGAPCEMPQVGEAVYAIGDEFENRIVFSKEEKLKLIGEK